MTGAPAPREAPSVEEAAAVTFRELAAQPRVESVGLSQLSIELGHLYMEDFAAGEGRLDAQFARIAPWARTAAQALVPAGRARPRISTCFLIDDYFTQFSSPAVVVPALLAAAERHGLEIDYLARESACAEADGVPLAELVAARLTALPTVGANGSRPPVLKSGWLCNGERSPSTEPAEAMRARTWAAPTEIGARNHSVFIDVELWHDREPKRLYSCAFLAAVWQLLRLGMVRNNGANVVHPVPQEDRPFPQTWAELPPITKLRPNATPFCAYRTFSALPSRFLQVENAVRVILAQTAPQQEVLEQLAERGERDGVRVSLDIGDRVDYAFIGNS
ncbi:MAG TPA: SCO2522 family protein [Pseudonocardiaceae bacterium]|nr:SCO2522 family protein [Pseudonocardiaceae bacterium]